MAPDFIDQLKTVYDQVQKCTKLEGQPFEELHIEVYNAVIQCDSGPCFGQFTEPNIIRYVLSFNFFSHEVIHYLLFLNTGDSDSNHQNELFKSCLIIS